MALCLSNVTEYNLYFIAGNILIHTDPKINQSAWIKVRHKSESKNHINCFVNTNLIYKFW